MKKLSICFIMIFTLLIGFTSCEDDQFENCPDITINVDNVSGSTVYRFAAQLNGLDDVRLTWLIDGEEVVTGTLDDIASQILDYQFEEGTYKVCVKVASDTCPLEVCKEITVIRDEDNPCPDLFFEAREYERPNQYKFIADFPGIEQTTYEWFINGEVVQDGDNYMFWEFTEPGRYEVCIKTETPECPNGTSYCKVIEIDEINEVRCPEIEFRKEIVPGAVRTYTFEALIENTTQQEEINWFINGNLVDTSNNRVLTYQFDTGVYEICMQVITEDCPNGVMYCKEYEFDQTDNVCPDLSFLADSIGDSRYVFVTDFDQANELEWLGWYINGELIDDSNNGDNNRIEYQFTQAGVYVVCLKTETPECPNGTEYCKEIVIEASITCPELSFEAEQDGDNPAYYFYPSAFDGIDNVTLSWSVDGDYVGTSSGHNEPFYYQFAAGTYDICLFVETPDCPNGVEFCKQIEVN